MTDSKHFNDSSRHLDRLARSAEIGIDEPVRITASGAKQELWPAKIIENIQFNLYRTCLIKLNQPGQNPVSLTTQLEAYNLAEPFDSPGQLPADTYIIIARIGTKNIFYAPV